MANGLPNTVYVIVAGGVLSAVLVPQIVRAGAHADGGSAYINKLLTLALVILGGATILATALAPLLTLALRRHAATARPSPLAIAFAWWCLPQIFFYGLYTLLGEVLNARRSFGPFTWVPVLNNVVAIVGLLVFATLFGFDPDGTRAADAWTPGDGRPARRVGDRSASRRRRSCSSGSGGASACATGPTSPGAASGLGTAGRMAGWTFGMLLLTTFAGIVQTQVARHGLGHGAPRSPRSTTRG